MDNQLRTNEADADVSDVVELDLKLPDSANNKKIKWRQTECYYLSYISEGMHKCVCDGAKCPRSASNRKHNHFFFANNKLFNISLNALINYIARIKLM